MLQSGDLIFCVSDGLLGLVIEIDDGTNEYATEGELWVDALFEGEMLGDWAEDYVIVGDNWNWPEWHENHEEEV